MILVNGESTEVLPVSDRGLQYGDGVWETIAIEKGEAIWLEEHLERLNRGLNALKITTINFDLLREEINQIIGELGKHQHLIIPNKILKIIITRGSGGRGYNPQGCTKPTRILSLHPWPDYPASYSSKGITMTLCETRLSHNPRLAGFKHLNRLEQVLARSEFGTEYQEGLVTDIDGNVIEATMSNLFIVTKNQTILTADLSQCGIEGIARLKIINILQKAGYEVCITKYKVADVLQAKSVFLSNSVIKMWPVKSFQHSTYEIPREIYSVIMKIHGFFNM
jgi:4-amino-4-deoxychorismate lyase